MKQAFVTNYVFDPSAGTLDLSSIPDFDIKKLYAVINTQSLTNKQLIYAVGIWQYSYTDLTAGVLTLSHDVSEMDASDELLILYDVSSVGENGATATPFSTLIAGMASDGNQYPIKVNTEGEVVVSNVSTTSSNRFNESTTSPGAEVLVDTYTVTVNPLFVFSVKVSCPIEGKALVVVNGTTVSSGRTSPGYPETKMDFYPRMELSIGDVLEIKFKARQNSAITEVESYINAGI